MNRKAHVARNFCVTETEELFKVTGSAVRSEGDGNVSEAVQDRDVVTTDH